MSFSLDLASLSNAYADGTLTKFTRAQLHVLDHCSE